MRHDDRNRLGRAGCCKRGRLARGYDNVHRQADELCGKLGKTVNVASGVAIVDCHVPPLDVAGGAQTLLKVPVSLSGAGGSAAVA